MSGDELTAIQAHERVAPTVPMPPGQVERRAFASIRHGTLSLISNFEVATGRVISPTLAPTRTEADFAAHIARTIATDAEAVGVFITDQVNMHQSERLVRLVAERCGLNDEVGVKGQTGMLQSLATRAAYVRDAAHRMQFVYLPKHTSWLNQIEIWLGILVRRVIKRGNFTSRDDVRTKIPDFITYCNCTAKPFRWTYAGRPLTV